MGKKWIEESFLVLLSMGWCSFFGVVDFGEIGYYIWIWIAVTLHFGMAFILPLKEV